MFETLGRVMLNEGQTLKIRCTACGHEDAWSRKAALATLGPHASPHFIRHRLVCGACLTRGRAEVWI